MKKFARRCLAVMAVLLLQACGGGGGDDSTGSGGAAAGNGITDSDVGLYARAVNVYAVNCSLYGYYQDCTAYYNAVYHFDSKCYQGVQQACQLSQDIQASYVLARLSRR